MCWWKYPEMARTKSQRSRIRKLRSRVKVMYLYVTCYTGICDSVTASANCRRRDVKQRFDDVLEVPRGKSQNSRKPTNNIELRNIRYIVVTSDDDVVDSNNDHRPNYKMWQLRCIVTWGHPTQRQSFSALSETAVPSLKWVNLLLSSCSLFTAHHHHHFL